MRLSKRTQTELDVELEKAEEVLPPCCICNKSIKTVVEIFCYICFKNSLKTKDFTINDDVCVCKQCGKTKKFEKFFKATKQRHDEHYHISIDLV